MYKHWSRAAVVRLSAAVAILIGGIVWGCWHIGPSQADPSQTQRQVPQTSLRVLYRLTDIGSISDAEEASAALNNTGDVVLKVGSQGFFWSAGHRMPLATVAGMPDMTVADINDSRQVVGGASITTSGAVTVTDGTAVLWSNGKATSLGSLPGLSDASAAAINAHGQVAGNSSSASFLESQDTMTGVTHAFLWEQGKMTDLGEGAAAALNNATQIAGTLPFSHAEGNGLISASHAALWERGKWRDLGTLPGWTFSAATGINISGDIVGYCYNGMEPEPSEAFRWQAGQMQDLGPGQATAINRGGQVVGRSGGRAMLWWHGRLCDLNTCLRGVHGWVLTSAVGVNDRGQIVGIGTNHGESHAFLLTPIHLLKLTRTGAAPQTAQMHLVAAATGGDRITLYWKGISGATGYNVYRSLASASETTRINSAPVRTRDPGVASGWTTTDRGLKNGVTYVYTVTALGRWGNEIARSNPSQAAPDPDAPPWDTRDAAKIAAKLWANAQSVDLPMDEGGPMLPPTPLDFTAPDGVVYQDPGVHIPPSPYRYLVHPTVAYDATDLGTLGGPSVVPHGLNNSGSVVGNAQPAPGDTRPALPFVWQGGTMQALPIPPSESPYGFGRGINAHGVVCGYGNINGRHQAALVWSAGSVHVLSPLPGGLQCAAYGINDANQVAGDSSDTRGQSHMVWWDGAGRLHDLGLGRLTGINTAGQVVGTRSGMVGNADRAVRSENGILHDLGTLGGQFSEGEAISSRGDVVGWSNIAHGSARGFLYFGGRMINLGLPPSADSSHATALNDADVIVGSAATPTGRVALIWQNNTMADLNDLTSLPPGVTLTEATAINDRGQICAVGHSGNTTRAYLNRAYLLTPRGTIARN